MTRSEAALWKQLEFDKAKSLDHYKAALAAEQKQVNERYAEFLQDRLAQKCLGFRLGPMADVAWFGVWAS